MALPWPRRVGAVATVVAVSIAIPSVAAGHDSLAPIGSPHHWLPAERWVFRHWIPFDEAELERALSLRAGELEAYLYSDHRTLAALARLRGIDPEQLADRLVVPWDGRVDEARIALLRDRTFRILTQGHLAQHVFFHGFHGVGMRAYAPQLFGVSAEEFVALRAAGYSAIEIARRHGVASTTTRSGLEALFREDHDAGIEAQRAWPAESDRVLARQLRSVSCWMRRPRPARDPGNPFGKATLQHGSHSAGWPFTDEDRMLDEVGVESVRRTLKRSCWRRPAPWIWPATEETEAATSVPRAKRLVWKRYGSGVGRFHRATVCALET